MKFSGAIILSGFVMSFTSLFFSMSLTAGAQEFSSTRACRLTNEVAQEEYLCDISIDKQVSINSGAFTDADDAGSSASAIVGDTVTWKITLTDNSFGFYEPYLDILITDILPDGFSYVSHTVTSGEYNQSEWMLPTRLFDEEQGDLGSLLPAELVIVSTADKEGTWENIATIESMNCEGWCEYEDGDSSNDSNNAFVSVVSQTQPRVLGESTTTITPPQSPQVLAATGNKIALVSLLVGSVLTGVVIYARKLSLNSKK